MPIVQEKRKAMRLPSRAIIYAKNPYLSSGVKRIIAAPLDADGVTAYNHSAL